MTVQPTRDQLRANAPEGGPWGAVVLALLDQLDQAEAELDSWMTRAYEAEKRAWQAEARIKAVEDVLDEQEAHFRAFWAANGKPDAATPGIPVADIRRALDT